MSESSQKYISIFMFLSITLILMYTVNQSTGHFLYFWDDPYIHMAVAQSIVEKGFPSADGHSISMASSSPLWTILLTGYYLVMSKIGNVKDFVYIPFDLNVLFGIMTLTVASKIKTDKVNFSPFMILFCAPLPIIPFIGMEHMLQIFLVTLLVYLSIEYSKTKEKALINKYIAVAFFASFTRYELFIFANILFVFMLTNEGLTIKDKVKMLGLNLSNITNNVVISLLPIILTGIYLKSNGLFFLPDSVVAKSVTGGDGFYSNVLHNLSIYFSIKSIVLPLLFPIATAYFAFFLQVLKKQELKTAPIAYAFGVMAIFHIFLAGPAFLRYDAYISAFSLIPIVEFVLLSKEKTACKLGALFLSYLFVVGGTLFLVRDVIGTYGVLIGTKNIHDQQIQSANFVNYLEKNNDGKIQTIALNDLGAVAYFTNSKIIDMVGLGTHEIAKLIKNGGPTGEQLKNEIVKNRVDWAIYYPNWFKEEQKNIREVCVPIGALKLKKNFICGGNEVVYDYCGKDIEKAKIDFLYFSKTVEKNTNKRVDITKTP